MHYFKVLNHKIDTRRPEDVIDFLVTKIGKPSKPFRVLQINPEIIIALGTETKLTANVDMLLPNGVGIQWAGTYLQNQSSKNFVKTLLWIFFKPRKLTTPFVERFTSSSFTLPLLQRLSQQSESVRILIAGAPKGNDIENTAAHIRKLGSNLHVTSFNAANFDTEKYRQLIKLAKQEAPDLVLLGIGYPDQECVASELREKLTHGIIVTEGGTFDYAQFGGKIKRAPENWQKYGLEWAWRLLREPTRIKRQLALVKFIMLVRKNNH